MFYLYASRNLCFTWWSNGKENAYWTYTLYIATIHLVYRYASHGIRPQQSSCQKNSLSEWSPRLQDGPLPIINGIIKVKLLNYNLIYPFIRPFIGEVPELRLYTTGEKGPSCFSRQLTKEMHLSENEHGTWKIMVGRRSFPFWTPYFWEGLFFPKQPLDKEKQSTINHQFLVYTPENEHNNGIWPFSNRKYISRVPFSSQPMLVYSIPTGYMLNVRFSEKQKTHLLSFGNRATSLSRLNISIMRRVITKPPPFFLRRVCEPRKKALITFEYTGRLIGILIIVYMVYYNPYIPG